MSAGLPGARQQVLSQHGTGARGAQGVLRIAAVIHATAVTLEQRAATGNPAATVGAEVSIAR